MQFMMAPSLHPKTIEPETKVNILLVDDEPKNLLALEAILESLDQNLVKASSGEDALKCLLKQDFAVILLDVQMPGMDGFETAKLIRQKQTLQHTPIIFITAINRDEAHVLKGYSLGASDYLLKPIVPEILVWKVSVFISLFKQTEEIKRKTLELEAANKELQKTQFALSQANEQLELKVARRTAQLQQVNEQLRAEIVERQQAEQALRENQELLQAILDNSPALISFKDPQGRYIWVNQEYEIISNIPKEDVKGKTDYDIFPQDIADRFAGNDKRVLQAGLALEFEDIVPLEDGIHTYIAQKFPLYHSPGIPYGVCGIYTDISDRKRAEDALRQQMQREQLLRTTLDHIRRSLDLNQILATTVTEVQKVLQADRVLIFRLYPDQTSRVVAEAVTPNLPTTLSMTFPDEIFPAECYDFYCQGQPRIISDVINDEWADCLLEFMQQIGVKSKIVAPIIQRVEENNSNLKTDSNSSNTPIQNSKSITTAAHSQTVAQGVRKIQNPKSKIQNRLWGLLIAHSCQDYRQWQKAEVDLLSSLANQLAIAIEQAELYATVQQELNRTKEAKEALRVSEERFQIALKNSPIIVFNHDTELRYTWIYNPTSEFTVDQILGKLDSDLLPPEDADRLMSIKRQVLTSGVGTRQEICLTNSNEVRYFDLTVEPLWNPDGKIIGITCATTDITEQKQAEEIRRALEVEKELRKVQLRFFSMASHEFRTPISTILGTAQILKSCAKEWPEAKRLKNILRIEKVARNMTQLIDDILTINRAESGKLEFNPQRLDLAEFCRHLVEEMQLSVGSNYQITLISQTQCPTAKLDEKLLHSLLSNLLSNAVKYSPQGGRVDLTLTCQEQEVIFKIKDSGIGIPLEDQRHLFELFHRGGNIGNIPGTGLGLSVVKKCVDVQGGKISVTSEVGVGTTVTVSISWIP